MLCEISLSRSLFELTKIYLAVQNIVITSDQHPEINLEFACFSVFIRLTPNIVKMESTAVNYHKIDRANFFLFYQFPINFDFCGQNVEPCLFFHLIKFAFIPLVIF